MSFLVKGAPGAARLLLVISLVVAMLGSACGSSDPVESSVDGLESTSAAAGGDPADAGGDPADAGDAADEAGDDPADAGDDPADAGDDPADAGDDPADAGDDPADAGDDPADAGDDPADAGDDPADAGDAADDASTVEAPKAEVAASLAENLTGLAPTDGETECLIEAAADRPAFDALLDRFTAAPDNVSDEELREMSGAVQGCLPADQLATWMSGSLGVTPQDSPATSECLAEPLSGPDGAEIMASVATRSVGRVVTPELQATSVEALAACVPVALLAPQFAYQAEAASGFAVVIDPECLAAELQAPELTEQFWAAVMAADPEPTVSLQAGIAACETDPNAGLSAEIPSDFVAWSGTRALASVQPALRNAIYSEAPPMVIDPSASYEAIIATGDGEIRIQLYADSAPVTVNNFVSLARDGYYDGTVFHRVLDDFMAQAGDPTGTGTGGPGYQFADEVDGGPALDRPGLLAMANAGPATNGSQFFITFVATEWLTGLHTVFGEVTAGQDIVDAIERRDPNAAASRGQVIEFIEIAES